MYHRVHYSDQKSSLTISPECFKKQIDFLQTKNFRFLSLEEVVAQKATAPLTSRCVTLSFDDGFLDNYEKAFSILLERKLKAALFVVVNWVGQKDFMNWDQIRELSRNGIEIGSHTLTHRWLPDITDSKELESELVDSKKRIEDEIQKEIPWFSYPVGGIDERVVEGVKKAGYRAAWVAGARPTASIKDPFFCLRRVKITPSDATSIRFGIKAYGIKGLFSYLR